MTRAAFLAGAFLFVLAGGVGRTEDADARFIPVVDADLRGGLTSVRHGKGARGLTGSALLLPAYRLTERGTIIPIYSFSGALSDKVVEEAVLFETRQNHAVSLGFKQGLPRNLEAKLSGEMGYALNQETRDEALGEGLYDYRDVGGRAGLAWKLKRDGRDEPVQGSVKVYKRAYPNFRSLAAENAQFIAGVNPAASAQIGDKETRPKDFIGTEMDLSAARWLARTLRLRAAYGLGLRSFTDRYLRTDQGLISGEKRADAVNRLELRGDWYGLKGLPLGTSLEGMYFASNGSFYDPNQAEYAYTPNWYQFYGLTWRMNLHWELPFGESLHPGVTVATGLGVRAYTDRLAQDSTGVNGDDTQTDTTYSLSLGGNYPITRWLGVVAGVTGQVVRSNNRFEQYVKYNYELLTASLGVTVRY